MDIYFINIGLALACLAIGYILGSIPNGLIIGEIFFKKDPRDYGSHNLGGTNCGRVFGTKVGIIVIVLDMIKTLIPVYLCWAILTFSGLKDAVYIWDQGNLYYWLAGLAAAVGHCWPIFAGFRGGKEVASFIGMVAGTNWLLGIIAGMVFFVILGKRKIVSLASLISGATIVFACWAVAVLDFVQKVDIRILSWTFAIPNGIKCGWEFATVITLMYGILLIRHISNIRRIKSGTESVFTYTK